LFEKVATRVALEGVNVTIAVSLDVVVGLVAVTVTLDPSHELLRIAWKQRWAYIVEHRLGMLVELLIQHRLKMSVLSLYQRVLALDLLLDVFGRQVSLIVDKVATLRLPGFAPASSTPTWIAWLHRFFCFLTSFAACLYFLGKMPWQSTPFKLILVFIKHFHFISQPFFLIK
jgi:hypothetical protein